MKITKLNWKIAETTRRFAFPIMFAAAFLACLIGCESYALMRVEATKDKLDHEMNVPAARTAQPLVIVRTRGDKANPELDHEAGW
jgi:hypothetical protein